MQRCARAAEVGAGDRVMFAFSFGPFLGFWLAFESAERLGCLCLPGGGLSSTARLRMMRDNKANVLCCTPTLVLHELMPSGLKRTRKIRSQTEVADLEVTLPASL